MLENLGRSNTEEDKKNEQRAVTPQEFMEYMQGQKINNLEQFHEGKASDGTTEIYKPDDKFRYVQDPDGEGYLDMKHVLTSAHTTQNNPLGGFGAEVLGAGLELKQMFDRTPEGKMADTAINHNDFQSNKAGTQIDGSKPLQDQLQQMFDARGKDNPDYEPVGGKPAQDQAANSPVQPVQPQAPADKPADAKPADASQDDQKDEGPVIQDATQAASDYTKGRLAAAREEALNRDIAVKNNPEVLAANQRDMEALNDPAQRAQREQKADQAVEKARAEAEAAGKPAPTALEEADLRSKQLRSDTADAEKSARTTDADGNDVAAKEYANQAKHEAGIESRNAGLVGAVDNAADGNAAGTAANLAAARSGHFNAQGYTPDGKENKADTARAGEWNAVAGAARTWDALDNVDDQGNWKPDIPEALGGALQVGSGIATMAEKNLVNPLANSAAAKLLGGPAAILQNAPDIVRKDGSIDAMAAVNTLTGVGTTVEGARQAQPVVQSFLQNNPVGQKLAQFGDDAARTVGNLPGAQALQNFGDDALRMAGNLPGAQTVQNLAQGAGSAVSKAAGPVLGGLNMAGWLDTADQVVTGGAMREGVVDTVAGAYATVGNAVNSAVEASDKLLQGDFQGAQQEFQQQFGEEQKYINQAMGENWNKASETLSSHVAETYFNPLDGLADGNLREMTNNALEAGVHLMDGNTDLAAQKAGWAMENVGQTVNSFTNNMAAAGEQTLRDIGDATGLNILNRVADQHAEDRNSDPEGFTAEALLNTTPVGMAANAIDDLTGGKAGELVQDGFNTLGNLASNLMGGGDDQQQQQDEQPDSQPQDEQMEAGLEDGVGEPTQEQLDAAQQLADIAEQQRQDFADLEIPPDLNVSDLVNEANEAGEPDFDMTGETPIDADAIGEMDLDQIQQAFGDIEIDGEPGQEDVPNGEEDLQQQTAQDTETPIDDGTDGYEDDMAYGDYAYGASGDDEFGLSDFEADGEYGAYGAMDMEGGYGEDLNDESFQEQGADQEFQEQPEQPEEADPLEQMDQMFQEGQAEPEQAAQPEPEVPEVDPAEDQAAIAEEAQAAEQAAAEQAAAEQAEQAAAEQAAAEQAAAEQAAAEQAAAEQAAAEQAAAEQAAAEQAAAEQAAAEAAAAEAAVAAAAAPTEEGAA